MNKFNIKAFLSTGHTAEFECNRIVWTESSGEKSLQFFSQLESDNEWQPINIVGSDVRVEAFTHEIVFDGDCIGSPSKDCTHAVCSIHAQSLDITREASSVMWVSHPCRTCMANTKNKRTDFWDGFEWSIIAYFEYGPDAMNGDEVLDWLKEHEPNSLFAQEERNPNNG